MQRELVFDGHKVSVRYEEPGFEETLDFLFQDLTESSTATPETELSVSFDNETGEWHLTRNEQSLFRGSDVNGLANILMGEVLFHLIAGNSRRLAIHAGLVSHAGGSILLPANSGSGKSSVTTWLINSGLHYHTDELVLIDLETLDLKAFTRPLNIKSRGVPAVDALFPLEPHRSAIRESSMVTMIPHRLVNPSFHREIPALSCLVFPQYIADSKPEITPLSRAEAGLELMRSNVIARNLPNHGFDRIIHIVRGIPAFRLHYRHFDDLEGLFRDIL